MIQTLSRDLGLPQQKPLPGTVIDPTHPLARDLGFCCLLNEGAGRAVYSIGQAGHKTDDIHQGLLTPYSTGPLPVWTRGRFGGSAINLTLNGANGGYITFGAGYSRLYGLSNATVLAWVNPTTLPSNPAIFSQRSAGGFAFQMDWYSNQYRFISSAATKVAAINATATGSWQQVVGTQNGGTVQIYLNGVAGTPDTGATTFGAGNIYIGAIDNSGTPAGFWNGLIDHVLIWKRTLSQSEIQWLYEEPFAMFLPAVSRHSGKAVAVATARSFAVIVG